MAEDEWSAIMNAPDAAEAHNLSAAARAAVWSAGTRGGVERRTASWWHRAMVHLFSSGCS